MKILSVILFDKFKKEKTLSLISYYTNIRGGNLFDDIKTEVDTQKLSNINSHNISYNGIYNKPANLDLFPEDSLLTLRYKVAAALGIPVYRLFLFTSEFIFYRIITSYGVSINIDPNELFEPDNEGEILFGTAVDSTLVKADRKVIVKTHEAFRTISENIFKSDTIYAVDFIDWLTPVWQQVGSATTSQKQYWYTGFVMKYWPLITEDFYNYIITGREHMIAEEVPEWASYHQLEKQTELLKLIHTVSMKSNAIEINKSFTQAITMTITSVLNPQTKINLMSLFNAISTNMNIPIIKLFAPVLGQSFIKTFPSAEVFSSINKVKIPSEFKKGIIIGLWIDVNVVFPVNAGKQMIFINITPSSTVYVYCRWREDFAINYDKHYAIMDKFVNPILNKINDNYGYYMHNQLNLVKPEMSKFETMTMMLYWSAIVTENQFNDIRKTLARDVNSGIFEYNRFSNIATKDTINMDFVKGGSHRDPDLITYRMPKDQYNYYSYLWSPQIRNVWNSLYRGFSFKLLHRSNDIRIEISNVTMRALDLFKLYISAYFSQLNVKDNNTIKEYKRKINKINHVDPVLYKFAMENEKGKKQNYSILCQEKKQPVIYNEDELDHLSERKKKKLIEYWNFTYNRPAYYECPSAEFPHLGFLVGKHPDGFCLACCQKLDPSLKPEYTECMKHEVDSKVEKLSKSARHIMIYRDMLVDPDRLSFIPSIAKFLNSENVFIYGVPQTLRGVGKIGMIESILLLLDTDVQRFLNEIKSSITDVYLWNDIYELFYKRNINHVFTTTTQEINEAFIDAVKNVYDINVVIINLQTSTVRSSIDSNMQNILIAAKSDEVYEPIVLVDLSIYFSAVETGKVEPKAAITKRVFSRKDLGVIIEKAIQRRGIDLRKVPSKVHSKIVYHGMDFGNVFEYKTAYIHLPSEFATDQVGDPGTVPWDKLSWPLLNEFLMANNVTISHGILSEGRVKIIIDNFQRIYFTDCAIEDFKLPIGDNWKYPIDEIMEALLIMNKEQKSTEFKLDLMREENKQIYDQMIFRHLLYLFILILSRYQNVEIRKEIMNRIINKHAPINQMKLPRADIDMIYRIMSQYHTSISRGQYIIIEQAINDFRFLFDEVFLEAMRRKPRDELKLMVMNMLKPYIKLEPYTAKTKLRLFHSLDFYVEYPLVISDEKIIDLMLDWFVNPMLRRYFNINTFDHIFEDNMKNIDFTRFVIKPGERFDIELNDEVEDISTLS